MYNVKERVDSSSMYKIKMMDSYKLMIFCFSGIPETEKTVMRGQLIANFNEPVYQASHFYRLLKKAEINVFGNEKVIMLIITIALLITQCLQKQLMKY